jgi:hypothetical protein
MRYFGDDEMLNLLEEIEKLLPFIQKHTQPENNADYNGTGQEPDNNSTTLATIQHLDTKLHDIIPKTLHPIGVYIRNHSDEFLQITD